MKKCILASFFCFLISPVIGFAQDAKWYNLPTTPRMLMVGAGPTFLGVNVKGGIFLKKHFLLGASVEVHELLSSRKEVGLFARKYLNSNRFSVFVQAGPSYGTFKEWDFDMDNETPGPTPIYRGLKLNAAAGAEIRITPMISIEGEFGIGRIMNTNWWAPSIRSSVNFRLYR